MPLVTLPKRYVTLSLLFHSVILSILVIGFDFFSPPPVIENSLKKDAINAVVLGDTAQSKILPDELAKPEEKPKPLPHQAETNNKPPEKSLAEQKALKAKQVQQLMADHLLKELKQHTVKKTKTTPKKTLSKKQRKAIEEQTEKTLREQLLKEQLRLKNKEAKHTQGEINKYKALILQAISAHWLVPLQAKKTLVCELLIRLAPGGMVLDVQVTKTSGDRALDSSARAAVLKASPLPVPSDPQAFDAFRQFALKVKPENVT